MLCTCRVMMSRYTCMRTLDWKSRSKKYQEFVSSLPNGLLQLNKIVYLSKHGTGSELWIANYDGTNKTKVNYSLPSGLIIDFVYGVRLSPDGKKLFFSASTDGFGETADGIYSCNVDGSNVTKIITSTNSTDSLHIGGAY
jgi:Tol biopolymer transport system component